MDASASASGGLAGAYLEKVTAFVTRTGPDGTRMLMIQHPTAGVQFPAGTVDEGEEIEHAAFRETFEECGISIDQLRLVQLIGQRDEFPPGATNTILHRTTVYALPNPNSFDWAYLPRGAAIQFLRKQNGYAQVTYQEGDRFPDPRYTSYQITGWVPESALAVANRRYFYHLAFTGDTPERWSQNADYHTFELFWAPLSDLPRIVPFQRSWYDHVTGPLGYRF